MEGNESAEKVEVSSMNQLNEYGKSHNKEEINGWERAGVRSLLVPAMLAAVVIILSMVLAMTPALAADNWAWVSKGPVGTDAMFLSCSRSQANVVFAGTNGGVYKTSDYGDNWSYSGIRFRGIDALLESGVCCNMGLLASASGDLFRSLDGGGTWNNIGSYGDKITALLVTSPPACHVYAGTYNGQLTPNGPGLAGIEITAMAVDSNNYVYAATSGYGIYKTTDNGLSWNQKNNGLTSNMVFSLKIDGSNRIFAGTLGGGVFRSVDGGESWEQRVTGLPVFDGTPEFYLAYSLAKDTDGNLYAGMLTDIPPAGSVYKSTDNGDNWGHTDSAIDGHFPNSMCVTSDNKLFVGTNLGMFRTDDFGDTWVNQTDRISAMPFTNTFAADSGGTVFIGSNGAGVYKSIDSGETWTESGTGSPRSVESLLIDGFGNLYASASDIAGVYKSEDNGTTWTLASDGLPRDFFPFVAGISLASDGSGDIYVGLDNGKVYKTTDKAENWSPTGDLPSNSERVVALVGIDAATVLAGTGGNGIYKTVDGGDTWVQIINSGLPESANIIDNSFFLDETSGYIYAGVWQGGLYRSTDGGDSWAQVSMPGVTGCDVRSVTRDENDNLYAVVCSGVVFRSTDNGDNWTYFSNNGLKPWNNVSGINVTGIVAYSGNIMISTGSSGMYKFSKDLAIIERAPDVYYSSLQDAYNAAQSGDSILALAVNFYSDNLLLFDGVDKSVVLKGGYEAGFASSPDMTSVAGALTVFQGTVVLQNMIVGSLTISEQGRVYAENVIIR